MRQISPDKKRTYVYSKTQGRLKPNASTFHLKVSIRRNAPFTL